MLNLHLLLENKIIGKNNIFSPLFYVKFVYDACVIFMNHNSVQSFIQRLQATNKFNFTHEECINNKFNFFDLKMKISKNGSTERDIHI